MPARIIKHVWHGMIQQDMGNKEKRFHPSKKPIPVMARIINDLTKPGDTIFDPFMGSGSTGVAAVMAGRNFIGCEKNKEFFDVAESRLKSAFLSPSLFTPSNTACTGLAGSPAAPSQTTLEGFTAPQAGSTPTRRK